MKTMQTSNNVIYVTPFDLSIMEVVETIAAVSGMHKKIILKDLGIHQTAWAKMLRNQRNVTTKEGRQREMIAILKGKYDVDPNYILNYPNQKTMFLTNELQDTGGRFEIKKYGSIITLKKSLSDCEKMINDLLDLQEKMQTQLNRTAQDLENALLLIESLKEKQNKRGPKPGPKG